MQINDILAQMGGFQSIARELGVSESQAASGAGALMPAILGGLKQQSQASGLGGLGDLLGQLGGGGLLDQVLSPQPTDPGPGNKGCTSCRATNHRANRFPKTPRGGVAVPNRATSADEHTRPASGRDGRAHETAGDSPTRASTQGRSGSVARAQRLHPRAARRVRRRALRQRR